MADKAKIIEEDGVKFSKENKAQVQEGLDWLSDWLDKRQKSGKLNSAEDESDINKAQKTLNNMTVVVSKDIGQSMINNLESGKLHFREDFIEEHGGTQESALEFIKDEINATDDLKKMVAINSRDVIAEPVIFVNGEALEKDEKVNGHSLIKSIIAHEATHAVDLNDSELECQILQLNENKQKGDYIDSDLEVYARLMQMRQELNLDPTKTYTLEDVQKMREQCVDRAEYTGDDRAQGKKMDWWIFERYSNEQILHFMNETSDNGKSAQNSYSPIDRQDMAATMKQDAKEAQMTVSCAREMAFLHTNDKQEQDTKTQSQPSKQQDISVAQLMAMKSERGLA